MAHALPPLPYPTNALEPHIDNTNKAPDGQAGPAGQTIHDLPPENKGGPENHRPAGGNHGGGHPNPSLFWTIMGPKAGGEPSGPLADAIKATFGDFAAF